MWFGRRRLGSGVMPLIGPVILMDACRGALTQTPGSLAPPFKLPPPATQSPSLQAPNTGVLFETSGLQPNMPQGAAIVANAETAQQPPDVEAPSLQGSSGPSSVP